jgi:hypothetical protein
VLNLGINSVDTRANEGTGYVKIHQNMINPYERSDIIHIMRMNRFSLSDSDTAHLEFARQVKGKDYRVAVLVVEDLPRVSIKQNGEVIFSDTIKSIDDLKIFLEERLYKYLEA